MCTFDPRYASKSMAPNLTLEERKEYLLLEIEKVADMLDGADTCKWIYQSLIHLRMLYKELSKDSPTQPDGTVRELKALLELDPLRAGRWIDLQKQIAND